MVDDVARYYFSAIRDGECEEEPRTVKEHPLKLLGRHLAESPQEPRLSRGRARGKDCAAWNLMDLFADSSEASSCSSSDARSVRSMEADQEEQQLQAEDDRDDSLAELWTGLWRLQGSKRLQKALPRLSQAVQKSCRAGLRRSLVECLRREVDDVVAEAVQDFWFMELCPLEDENSGPSEASKMFQHDGCSTSSTVAVGSESCTSSSVDTERFSPREDAEVPTAAVAPPSPRSPPLLPSDAAEQAPWELEFASMAAADKLWQRLRDRDLVGAEQLITATREEVGMALLGTTGVGRLSILELVPGPTRSESRAQNS